MENDLVNRYIYAVSSNLPAKMKTEVEQEVSSMISDLLDAKCNGASPSEEDIRTVLTELGTPEGLALRYIGEENKSLISGIYLLWYKRLLKIVVPIAAAGVAFATLLSHLLNWQPAIELLSIFPTFFAEILAGAIGAAFQAFAMVTIIFIILEHKKVTFDSTEFLSKLHPVPDKKSQIKIHEPIINIFWHFASLVLFLLFPYLIGIYLEGFGWIPAFNVEVIRSMWYFVVLWATLGIVREIFKLKDRRYSNGLCIVTVIINLLTGITSVFFFTHSNLLNPEFVTRVETVIQDIGIDQVRYLLEHANYCLLILILFALIIDTVTTIFRTIRYNR